MMVSHPVPLSQPPQEVNRPRLAIKHHLMARPRPGPVLVPRRRDAQAAPRVRRDLVRPEVVQRPLPVPPAEQVDDAALLVDAHRVAPASARHVAVGVEPAHAAPAHPRLARVAVRAEEACVGAVADELLGLGPGAVQDEGGVEGRDQGVLELEAGAGEDLGDGCEEAALAEVLEDLAEGDVLAVLSFPSVGTWVILMGMIEYLLMPEADVFDVRLVGDA